MNKKLLKDNIDLASQYSEELRQLASSLCEDVKDSRNMTEAWKKIDMFYQSVEGLRNLQKCTGSKGFSVLQDDVEGHTKYLQGINLPIMVNSVWESDNNCHPSPVCEMHVGRVDDRLVLLITPENIILPNLQAKVNWFEKITDRLRDYSEGEIWSNGDEILCKSKEAADTLADMFETLYKTQGDEIIVKTGYYDPEEDKKNNEEDRHTGWWYIGIQ